MARTSLFHICSRQGDEMSTAIRDRARSYLYDVASYAPPHLTIKGKIEFVRREFKNKIKLWRLEAGWYGHAGSWSAAAIYELEQTYSVWKQERLAKAKSADALERSRRLSRDRELLEQSRAEALQALSRIEARLALIGEQP